MLLIARNEKQTLSNLSKKKILKNWLKKLMVCLLEAMVNVPVRIPTGNK